jgi:hypothetical protein
LKYTLKGVMICVASTSRLSHQFLWHCTHTLHQAVAVHAAWCTTHIAVT